MAGTDLWLVRYGEIFLKSDYVRRQWEQALVRNIREVLPDCRVRSERGRIWITGVVDQEKLRRVFGIVSFSPVTRCAWRSFPGPGRCSLAHSAALLPARAPKTMVSANMPKAGKAKK
jgi:hypothetical protein